MNDTLHAAIAAVHAEAEGMLTLGILDAEASADLLAAAAMGNALAAGLIGALLESRRRITDAPRYKSSLCCICPRPVRRISPDSVFGIVFPAIARPKSAISFAFGNKCAADRATLLKKTEARLRSIWPELRPIIVTHPAGGLAQ